MSTKFSENTEFDGNHQKCQCDVCRQHCTASVHLDVWDGVNVCEDCALRIFVRLRDIRVQSELVPVFPAHPGLNNPVQSLASDSGLRLLNHVHDEVTLRVPEAAIPDATSLSMEATLDAIRFAETYSIRKTTPEELEAHAAHSGSPDGGLPFGGSVPAQYSEADRLFMVQMHGMLLEIHAATVAKKDESK